MYPCMYVSTITMRTRAFTITEILVNTHSFCKCLIYLKLQIKNKINCNWDNESDGQPLAECFVNCHLLTNGDRMPDYFAHSHIVIFTCPWERCTVERKSCEGHKHCNTSRSVMPLCQSFLLPFLVWHLTLPILALAKCFPYFRLSRVSYIIQLL